MKPRLPRVLVPRLWFLIPVPRNAAKSLWRNADSRPGLGNAED